MTDHTDNDHWRSLGRLEGSVSAISQGMGDMKGSIEQLHKRISDHRDEAKACYDRIENRLVQLDGVPDRLTSHSARLEAVEAQPIGTGTRPLKKRWPTLGEFAAECAISASKTAAIAVLLGLIYLGFRLVADSELPGRITTETTEERP